MLESLGSHLHALLEREQVAPDLGLAVHDRHDQRLAAGLGPLDQVDVTVGDGIAADGNHPAFELEFGHVASSCVFRAGRKLTAQREFCQS